MTTIQIWFAVVGLVVSAIGGPFIKKHFFDSRLKLRVTIRVCPARTSRLVGRIISDYLQALPYGSIDGAAQRNLLNSFGSVKGYSVITIRNISKKKLTNVTLLVDDLYAVSQMDDSDDLLMVETGKPLAIGDISPNHERVVHFWSLSDKSERLFSTVKQSYQFSADELDSVTLRFPLADYLKRRFVNWAFWGFYITIVAAFAFILLTNAVRQ